MLGRIAAAMDPLLDSAPPSLSGSLASQVRAGIPLARFASQLGRDIPDALRIMTAPAAQILNEHFESDVLKATLATDAVIGAFVGPETPGSAYAEERKGTRKVTRDREGVGDGGFKWHFPPSFNDVVLYVDDVICVFMV